MKDRFDVEYRGTGFRGYPIGTVCYYGPDDKTTTKIVASIVEGEQQDPSVVKKWQGDNVAKDPKVKRAIKSFLKEFKAKSTIITASPIGCPHEEGIDFPTGGDCPQCPFWKGKQ